MDQGYVVMPFAGAIRMFTVVAPDGEIVSMHRAHATAWAKAKRLNRATWQQTLRKRRARKIHDNAIR